MTRSTPDARHGHRLTADGAWVAPLIAMGDRGEGEAILDALLDAQT